MHNYSKINWTDIFQYSENSPTGLISQRTGKPIGTLRFNKEGKRVNIEVYIKKKCFIVSRIIWAMHHDLIDETMYIDHLDGNPHNNRLDNLRCVTPLENSRNMARKASITNPTGITGVFYQQVENKDGTVREYYIAKVGIGNCIVGRYFSIGKLGKEEAFKEATAFRMQHLNESNHYTERHGVEIRK